MWVWQAVEVAHQLLKGERNAIDDAVVYCTVYDVQVEPACAIMSVINHSNSQQIKKKCTSLPWKKQRHRDPCEVLGILPLIF